MDRARFLTLVIAATLISACSDSGPDGQSRAAAEPDNKLLGPPLSVSEADLEAALDCPDEFTSDRATEPVLLIHGTFTNGPEQWEWNYRPLLESLGLDVCLITYPDRGFGDQQISAEYIVYAVREIKTRSQGRKVDMIGHSQGASMPRWALRWWPEVRNAVDDFVLIAPPSHGTEVAAGRGGPGSEMPAAFYQFDPASQFVAAVNSCDETPGAVDYTVIYTLFDELVQPAIPESTAALDAGAEEPNTVNIFMQDVCPGHFVDHVTIGTTDSVAKDIALDALMNDGPASLERLGDLSLSCAMHTFVDPSQAGPGFFESGADFFSNATPGDHNTDAEPPLRDYAKDPQCD